MKRFKKTLTVLLSMLCLTLIAPMPMALADSSKVVTLGADLSNDEQQMILDYFGVSGSDVPMLTINNTDEREHLQDYVPLEQIGTRTYSCSYVSPTDEGGIHVKTANLTWVTSNMIAAALSTSGVANCDVLAASPFAVSGTGALTGILIAYETAADEELDEDKKDASMQELVTTAEIGDDIGQDLATLLVNEAKREVMEDDGLTEDDVRKIVEDIAEEYSIGLTDEDRQLLEDLLVKISELDYDIQAVTETLDLVEENAVNNINDDPDIDISIEISSNSSTGDSSAGNTNTVENDSILNNTDDSALNEDVIFDTTYETSYDSEDEAVNNDADADAETEKETEEETESFFDKVGDAVGAFVDGVFGADEEDAEDENKTIDETIDEIIEETAGETEEDDGMVHSIIGDLFEDDVAESINDDAIDIQLEEDFETPEETETEDIPESELKLFSFMELKDDALESFLINLHDITECSEITDCEEAEENADDLFSDFETETETEAEDPFLEEEDGWKLYVTDIDGNVYYVEADAEGEIITVCLDDADGDILYPEEESPFDNLFE